MKVTSCASEPLHDLCMGAGGTAGNRLSTSPKSIRFRSMEATSIWPHCKANRLPPQHTRWFPRTIVQDRPDTMPRFLADFLCEIHRVAASHSPLFRVIFTARADVSGATRSYHAGTRRRTSSERSGTSTPKALHRAIACCVAVTMAKDPCESTKQAHASPPWPIGAGVPV